MSRIKSKLLVFVLIPSFLNLLLFSFLRAHSSYWLIIQFVFVSILTWTVRLIGLFLPKLSLVQHFCAKVLLLYHLKLSPCYWFSLIALQFLHLQIIAYLRDIPWSVNRSLVWNLAPDELTICICSIKRTKVFLILLFLLLHHNNLTQDKVICLRFMTLSIFTYP